MDIEMLARLGIEEERDGNGYERLIVDDRCRAEAQADFVAELVEVEGDLPGIVFVRRRRHAVLLAEAIGERLGEVVPAISSKMPKKQRDVYAQQMRDRVLRVAVCTAVWSTGIDIPSIEWLLMAGAGQAPAGLKQMFGRGTRLDDDKLGYTVYDWQDIGPDTENYQEQSELRMQHYTAAGLQVGALRAPPTTADDPDVDRLARLLTKTEPTPIDPAAFEPPVQPDTWWRPYGVTLWFGIAMILLLILPATCDMCGSATRSLASGDGCVTMAGR